jgi:hypothetical protein
MNNKKCKALRAKARQLAPASNESVYVRAQRENRNTSKFNSGKMLITASPYCRLYKQLKKEYKLTGVIQ